MTIASQNISLGLNTNNDLYLGNDNNLVTVTGVEAVQQDCLCAMKAQFGEMVFQPTSGLPNLTDVWQQKKLIKWEAAARATLLAVPGVTQVVSFAYSITGEVLNYQATIQTIYSQMLVINENITGAGQ